MITGALGTFAISSELTAIPIVLTHPDGSTEAESLAVDPSTIQQESDAQAVLTNYLAAINTATP